MNELGLNWNEKTVIKISIEGFHLTSYQANFASLHTHDWFGLFPRSIARYRKTEENVLLPFI